MRYGGISWTTMQVRGGRSVHWRQCAGGGGSAAVGHRAAYPSRMKKEKTIQYRTMMKPIMQEPRRLPLNAP